MRYLSVEEGRKAPGLRLVLTQGVPGPWGESAKAIFKIKGLAYQAEVRARLDTVEESLGAQPGIQKALLTLSAPGDATDLRPARVTAG